MELLPFPHPLDSDWRYDENTARNIADMLPRSGKILSLGVPSVARLIEANGGDITLVDRQPVQGVRNHIASEIENFNSETVYDAAIIDPPWYPQHLAIWLQVAAKAVKPGGLIFLSAWPKDTRPEADIELENLLNYFSTWADIERNVGYPVYLESWFETIARRAGSNGPLSKSPLRGELILLRLRQNSDGITKPINLSIWHRFIVNNYQIAVRYEKKKGAQGIQKLPMARGWTWPFVSTRANGIKKISIWSSNGEVGIVGNAIITILTLRKAFKCQDFASFEHILSITPELLEWSLPRPPYERLIEWRHQH